MNIDPDIVATVLLTVWADKLLSAAVGTTKLYSRLHEWYFNFSDRHYWRKEQL